MASSTLPQLHSRQAPDTKRPDEIIEPPRPEPPRRSDPRGFDPTYGMQIGSEPYDDPTQGRKLGSDPKTRRKSPLRAQRASPTLLGEVVGQKLGPSRLRDHGSISGLIF